MRGAKEFLQGMACGLAALNRLHDQPTMICDTMRSFGVTLIDLRSAGVDHYDLVEIAACLMQGTAGDRVQVSQDHRARMHVPRR